MDSLPSREYKRIATFYPIEDDYDRRIIVTQNSRMGTRAMYFSPEITTREFDNIEFSSENIQSIIRCLESVLILVKDWGMDVVSNREVLEGLSDER